MFIQLLQLLYLFSQGFVLIFQDSDSFLQRLYIFLCDDTTRPNGQRYRHLQMDRRMDKQWDSLSSLQSQKMKHPPVQLRLYKYGHVHFQSILNRTEPPIITIYYLGGCSESCVMKRPKGHRMVYICKPCLRKIGPKYTYRHANISPPNSTW